MEFKKEIESLLEILENKGFSREEIEKGVNRSPNWIDQALARGGNEKAYNLIKMFNDSNVAKSNVNRGTSENKDTMYLLQLSLEANAEHAAANKENASANNKHADNLAKLIEMLDIKFNSGKNGSVSQSAKDVKKPGSGRPERKPLFVDKDEKGLNVKKASKKDKSALKDKQHI